MNFVKNLKEARKNLGIPDSDLVDIITKQRCE